MIPVETLEGVDLELIKEGRVEVEVPSSTTASRRGPARADAPVFYNPAMELARDVSVSLLRAAGSRSWRVLDGLAGTGIRGVRYAVEGPSPKEVVLNDLNPVASALCMRNLELNGVENGTVSRRRLEVLLLEDWFDMVDIDPFGSPVRFLAGAVRGTRRGGVIAVTATDTPALCGSKPRVCLRRYGARPWRGDSMHEVALRILAGAVVREAARLDRAARPLLCMAEDHYVRVFLEVTEGARRADDALSSIGYAWATPDGGVAVGATIDEGTRQWAGPLWTGPLHERETLGTIAGDGDRPTSPRLERLLEIWGEEADLPPLLLDANRLSSRLKVSSPRMGSILDGLRGRGFAAGRAHTNPVGVKTDAPISEVESVIGELAGRS